MDSKELYIAIQDVVKERGESILTSPQFVNILADYSAFKAYPACKIIMRDMLQTGEIEKIYQTYKTKGKNCKEDIEGFCRSKQKEGKFKYKLVSYTYNSFLVAFGCASKIEGLENEGFEAYAKTDFLDSLSEQLENLKQDYLDILNKKAVLPKNLLTDPAGYYPATIANELYLVEAKYKVIASAINEKDLDWCQKQKAKHMEKFREEKRNFCQQKLLELKTQYIEELKKILIISRPRILRPNPYFLEDDLARLEPLETNIKTLYTQLGEKYDDFCKESQDELLDLYYLPPTKRISQIVVKILMPAIFIIFILLVAISWINSSKSREHFNKLMDEASEMSERGNYTSALGLYQEAGSSYQDDEFLSSFYQGQADDAIKNTVANICAKVEELASSKDFSSAQKELASMPQEAIEIDSETKLLVEQTTEKLKQAASDSRDVLMENVSTNGGKLDHGGEDILNEALKVVPDDYWLNIIKKKNK